MELGLDETESTLWSLIDDFTRRSDRLFLKKLSRNDASWADDGGGHQYGFYVPRDIRESGFFPVLTAREDKPHILESLCPSVWPQTGEVKNDSRIKFFSNKRSECHFTRIPAELFKGLSPASWLLGGRLLEAEGNAHHWFIVIDSASLDAELLESRLNIQADFHFELLEPASLKNALRIQADEAAELIAEIDFALRNGSIDSLLARYGSLPSPEELAKQARASFLASSKYESLNPWTISKPGDAIMRISRDIEFSIYRKHELRIRAIEVAKILSTHSNAATAAVQGFPSLDAVFLSASQQRKSRAGKSFESHLATLLRAGGVKYEAQAILGQRRPDFVLPDQATVALGSGRSYEDAAILSAKTTLRERWKQLTHERFNCAIYLATVDDRVSKEALNELRIAEITLVVPESLKMRTAESFYSEDANVISFRTFFDEELARKRPALLLAN